MRPGELIALATVLLAACEPIPRDAIGELRGTVIDARDREPASR